MAGRCRFWFTLFRLVLPGRNGWERVFGTLALRTYGSVGEGGIWFQAMLEELVWGFVHTASELGGASTEGYSVWPG